MSKQLDLAATVALTLQDDDHDITTLDLLDTLATTGLKLDVDPNGEATMAYQEAQIVKE